MNDKNREEIMWKYIDGLCDKAQANEVEIRLQNDPIFASEFEQLKELDKSLEQTILHQAPDHISSAILAQVAQHKQAEHASFGFVPFMVFVLILLSLTIYLMPEASSNQNAQIPFDWSIFEVNIEMSQSYLSYILGALAAVFLVWVDFFFNRRSGLIKATE